MAANEDHLLNLTIHCGYGLPVDVFREIVQPYVICKLDGVEVGRTDTVTIDVNPFWNYNLTCRIRDSNKEIVLEVWDQDDFGKDEYIGISKILLSDNLLSGGFFSEDNFNLTTRSGEPVSGIVVVSAFLQSDLASLPEVKGYKMRLSFRKLCGIQVTEKTKIQIELTHPSFSLITYRTKNEPSTTLCDVVWKETWCMGAFLPLSSFDLNIKIFKSETSDSPIIAKGTYTVTEEQFLGDPGNFEIPLADDTNTTEEKHLSLHSIFYRSSNRYSAYVHVNYVKHFTTGSWSITKWPCYDLVLEGAHQMFEGKKQEWCRTYEAAKQIYTNKVAIGAVRLQHSYLYYEGKDDVKGMISTVDQFFELIDFGFRGFKIRRFTYVIDLEGHFRFSETGINFKDLMSKHAAHANCSEEVYYAGEFWVLKTSETGRYCLYINNDSGTFRPHEGSLPNLKSLLETNFPNMEIVVFCVGTEEFDVHRDRFQRQKDLEHGEED